MNTSHTLLCARDEVPDPHSISRIPQRPLGALSNFVVEQLPGACADSRALPNDDTINQYSQAGSDLLKNCDSKAAVHALLDAVMLEQAFFQHDIQSPPALKRLIVQSAKQANSAPALTYEGLIFGNPLQSDPRVFSSGELGRTELLFYEVHLRIEQELAKTCVAINACIQVDPDQALGTVHQAIDVIEGGFRSFHVGMTLEEFKQFRDFFKNDRRRLPGPSALFSPGMCTLDGLLAGSADGIRHLNSYKMKLLMLFPGTTAASDGFCGREDIQATLQTPQGGLLFDERLPVEKRISLAKRMKHARSMHLGIAKKYIPEAFAHEDGQVVKGTAGLQSLQSFLAVAREGYASLERLLPLLTSLRPTHGASSL